MRLPALGAGGAAGTAVCILHGTLSLTRVGFLETFYFLVGTWKSFPWPLSQPPHT